jgi:hypothetical protein
VAKQQICRVDQFACLLSASGVDKPVLYRSRLRRREAKPLQPCCADGARCKKRLVAQSFTKTVARAISSDTKEDAAGKQPISPDVHLSKHEARLRCNYGNRPGGKTKAELSNRAWGPCPQHNKAVDGSKQSSRRCVLLVLGGQTTARPASMRPMVVLDSANVAFLEAGLPEGIASQRDGSHMHITRV